MEPEVFLGAARRLSIDVANLTMQLALAQARLEILVETNREIDYTKWERQMFSDNGSESYVVILTAEQAEQVERVLLLINTLL